MRRKRRSREGGAWNPRRVRPARAAPAARTRPHASGSRRGRRPSGRWSTGRRRMPTSSPRRWSLLASFRVRTVFPDDVLAEVDQPPRRPRPVRLRRVARTCATRRSSRSTATTRRTTTTRSGSRAARRRQPGDRRAHRRRRALRAARNRARRRGDGARDQRLPRRPGRADAARGAVEQPVLAGAEAGPARLLGDHGVHPGTAHARRRARAQERDPQRAPQHLPHRAGAARWASRHRGDAEIAVPRGATEAVPRLDDPAAEDPRREGLAAHAVHRAQVRVRRRPRGRGDRRRAELLLADADRGDRARRQPGGGGSVPPARAADDLPRAPREGPRGDRGRSRRCSRSTASACRTRTG